MALEGTLKDFSLADIFQLIGLQRKTGVLTLKGKDDVVTVSFLDGRVVSADSLQRRVENRLGRVLVKTGRLEGDALDRALEIQRQTLQRLGTILVDNAMIEGAELKNALQTQILQTVYALFRWKDGDYKFSQESSIEYDRDYVTPIQAESILMEGARMIDEWPIIERRIKSYDMVFRKVPVRQAVEVADEDDDLDEIDFGADASTAVKPGEKNAAIKISSAEWQVYEVLDGTINVRELLERSRYGEFETVKALYELLSRGLIEEARAAVEAEAAGEATVVARAPRVLLGPLVAAVVAVGFVIGAMVMKSNPANLAIHGAPETRIQNVLQRSISLSRIERIASAIETFMLANGHYPVNLAELVASKLVDESEVVDPWGRKYRYENQNDKFFVVGFRPDGTTDSRLFISKSIDRTRDTGSQAEGSGPGIILAD